MLSPLGSGSASCHRRSVASIRIQGELSYDRFSLDMPPSQDDREIFADPDRFLTLRERREATTKVGCLPSQLVAAFAAASRKSSFTMLSLFIISSLTVLHISTESFPEQMSVLWLTRRTPLDGKIQQSSVNRIQRS